MRLLSSFKDNLVIFKKIICHSDLEVEKIFYYEKLMMLQHLARLVPANRSLVPKKAGDLGTLIIIII